MSAVERVAEGVNAVYYRVQISQESARTVTVRVGKEGRYACLTCLSVRCDHAAAAEGFAARESAQ